MANEVSHVSNSRPASTSVSPASVAGGVFRLGARSAQGAVVGGPVGAGVAAVSEVASQILAGGSGNPAPNNGVDIAGMQAANMELLQTQVQVSTMSNQFNSTSNVLKADHDARQNTIRSFKA